MHTGSTMGGMTGTVPRDPGSSATTAENAAPVSTVAVKEMVSLTPDPHTAPAKENKANSGISAHYSGSCT